MAIREQKIFAMNIVAELLVEDIAKETRRPREEVLLKFMQSEMAEKLYDDSLKLWWDGPDALRERYKEELATKCCEKTK